MVDRERSRERARRQAGTRRASGGAVVVRATERKARDPAHGVLYRVVAEHLEAFLDRASESGPGLPAHVRRELAAYLDCGVVERGGAACLVCEDCGERVCTLSRRTTSFYQRTGTEY